MSEINNNEVEKPAIHDTVSETREEKSDLNLADEIGNPTESDEKSDLQEAMEVDPKIKECASFLMKDEKFGEYIVEQQGKVENGVEITEDNAKYTLKTGEHFTNEDDGVELHGRDEGRIVTSSEAMDKMLDRAYNDTDAFAAEINERRESEGKDPIEAKPLRIAEDQLGLNEGDLGERAIRVDVPNADKYDLRLPDKNDDGANENFIEGGKTSGGMPEAMMQEKPLMDTENISIYKNDSEKYN